MIFSGASEPGNPEKPNEDWAATSLESLVVLDGATVRTGTGCDHGVPWYAGCLGARLISPTCPGGSLAEVLAEAIAAVAALHAECDLTHPGTPSAAVAITRFEADTLRWLVLGDVTIVLDTVDGIRVICDDRVSKTAAVERAQVDRHLIGTPEKAEALIPMKHAELATRNREGGYWISAADPAVVSHALTGEIPAAHVRRMAILTDGAARAVTPFALRSWAELLDLLHHDGPDALIRTVRAAERADPVGARHPRNKASDDATVLYSTR